MPCATRCSGSSRWWSRWRRGTRISGSTSTTCGSRMSETRWAHLREILLHHHVEPARLAAAVALGVFIGLTPFYGLQTVLAIVLAGLLRLNITAAVVATQISNP